jgi:hypothetical protein
MGQEYVRRGNLEAVVEGKSVSKAYYISIDSLNALRERRNSEAKGAQYFARVTSENEFSEKSREVVGEAVGETLRMVIERREARTAEAADLRTRLELTVQTESTLREALDRERLRADQERDRANRLEAELIKRDRGTAIGAARCPCSLRGHARKRTGRQAGGIVVQEGQEEVRQRRSWLYRFFSGP